MRTVYLKGRFRGGPFHSLYKELTEFPPQGYCYISDLMKSSKSKQPSQPLSRIQRMIRQIDGKMRSNNSVWSIWNEAKTMSYLLVKEYRDSKFKNLPEARASLIYCSQQLLFAKLPWIVDVEYANSLVGGNEIRVVRRAVQHCLASKYCKKVLPWSDWSEKTLYRSMDCSSFKNKIETVHFAIRPKKVIQKKASDNTRLLFVGSTNLENALNFERKGGVETIESFLELRKKYDKLDLVVRSWVPREIKAKYSGIPGLKILDSPLSNEGLRQLYVSSDIFLFPSHLNLGMGILEAMSYELPVIARRVFDIPEAVEDMKTGLLLEPLKNLPYYLWNGAPNVFDREFLLGIRRYRARFIEQIVEKTSVLIENTSLTKKLGRQARTTIEEGKFSIENRNAKLKRIFDEVLRTN